MRFIPQTKVWGFLTWIQVKKGGKFLADIGYAPPSKKYNILDETNTQLQFGKPLLLIRENDIKFNEEIFDDERITLLSKIDAIRSKIINEIKESNDTSIIHIT